MAWRDYSTSISVPGEERWQDQHLSAGGGGAGHTETHKHTYTQLIYLWCSGMRHIRTLNAVMTGTSSELCGRHTGIQQGLCLAECHELCEGK